MSLNPFQMKGIPLEKQYRSWGQIVQAPYLKQEVDAYTRCRVILMNGIEMEAFVFSHSFARMSDNDEIKARLAQVRRIDQQQQITVNWLNPADQSGLETTVAYEQVAIDLTAFLARTEPDPYVKEVFDFGLLEDFDHLYRYSQMLDLVEGKDPTTITQGKTEIFPGRPTQDHHNDPIIRLREHYAKEKAHPISKANCLTLLASEQQTYNYYKNIGFLYGSPEVRKLYAEISEVEEEHVTQYESLIDPNETWLEKWVLHEFTEASNYYACYMTETDPRIKLIWELFLNYEIEHLRIAGEMLKKYERIDPEQIVGSVLPIPGTFQGNKEYVADVLVKQGALRMTEDKGFRHMLDLADTWPSYAYQRTVNADGSPSETAVALRQMVAGQEFVSASAERAPQAGATRTTLLDKEQAPNTAPISTAALVPSPTASEAGHETQRAIRQRIAQDALRVAPNGMGPEPVPSSDLSSLYQAEVVPHIDSTTSGT